MIKTFLVLLSILYLSACDVGDNATDNPAITAGAANPTTDPISIDSVGTDVDIAKSQIEGNIILVNDTLPSGDIVVQIRGSQISSTRQSNGDFSIEIPASDIDRTLALDITGDAIVNQSISLQVPAQGKFVLVDTTVTAATPAITFNLDTGGQLQNEDSPTRTSVSVPANAFQFSNGTLATGNAQVSITEIDITDLHGDSAWAPNLIGIPEGMNEAVAIYTFGMSDFQFSQDGQELNLRAGVEATIEIDLVSPYVMAEGISVPIEATEGIIMPLWHFDMDEMVWREEGEATVVADNQSDSGFKASGRVSHFSTWNIDFVTPSMNALVNVIVVDQYGNVRSDKVVDGYSVTVRIPPEDGPGHNFGETSWSNTQALTPLYNQIEVLGNTAERQNYIDTNFQGTTGWTTMDVIVNSVVINGAEVANTGLSPIKKIFKIYEGDNTVTFRIVCPTTDPDPDPDPDPVPVPAPVPVGVSASVKIELIDFDGRVYKDIDVISYNATARALETSVTNTANLTPGSNKITVQGNTQELIDAGFTVTTQISIDSIEIEEPYQSGIIPGAITRVFMSQGGDTVTFKVVVLPQ